MSKLAPSGVAAALIQGTTIHNFFKLDITGKSSLQNGTVDATAIRKTDVIIIDEFGMIDCKIFLTIENLCRRFSTKDGRHKPWGGRHILLFGDPAQLPPVSNTDIFNTKLWLQFSIVQLREIVRSKDPELSAILSEIRMGKCDETVCSVLKSRLRNVDIDAVDLTRTVIICSKRKEVDLINEECLKRIDGDTHEYKAIDTDSNGQPLREADKQRLQRTPMRLPDTITLKRGCRIVLRRNLQIPQGWVNGALCEVLDITPNCILVCKLGKPDKMYPIARTKQRIDIKGASYSILQSQFPVQLAYAVTVHRVQGLTVDSAIVTLNNNFFASGQAYVALSRVRKLDNLILWDFTPSAIKIAPYYKQLLEWCESVDVIRPTPYDGPCVRYPDRQNDDISCSTMDDDMEAALDIMYQKCEAATMPNTNKQVNFDINTEKNDFYKGSSSNNVPSSAIKQQKPNKVRVTISKTNKKVKGKRDSLKQSPKSKTVAVKATALSSRKRKHVPDKRSIGVKKTKTSSTECMITDVENVIGPNRTVWPEYCYHQIDRAWQENACSRMGIQFTHANEFQPGGPHVILTRPNLNSLVNVQGDGNCLFCALTCIVTGCEMQHMEMRNAVLSYMLSIEHLLVGHDSEGHANYMQPLNYSTVQDYINNSRMSVNGTWGTELEMMVFSHMPTTNVYSFDATSNTWNVFSPANIDRTAARDYTTMSVYIYLRHSDFYVVSSIRTL